MRVCLPATTVLACIRVLFCACACCCDLDFVLSWQDVAYTATGMRFVSSTDEVTHAVSVRLFVRLFARLLVCSIAIAILVNVV